MTRRSTALPVVSLLTGLLLATAWVPVDRLVAVSAAPAIPQPEQFIGFKVGADNKLVRWDTLVDYMRQVASASDRVNLRELGKTNGNQPFIVLEISSPETIRNLDRQKQLARKLYFQDGTPSARDRDDLFRRGKLVVLMTCSIHADEIGPSQMTLELVHQLATSDAPAIKNILDNVIFLLVPSLNPDGQIMVTDWFARNLGTPYENSPLPSLYHPYAGHDNNRDMFMFTQKESEYTARLAWHDWFPVVWLDAHQMGRNGPRIFVMPATDPINPNVHPLIYRWNAILGQSQAAALEAAGKTGIIYNSTYTNFWQGAMAWSGWWHNQIGLLTEIASVRIAAPTVQLRAPADRFMPPSLESGSAPVRYDSAPIMPPTDTLSRTEYPRPWLGGRWTLRDIVDYQLISTFGLLETAADLRETIMRQVFDVNRSTVEEMRVGDVRAILLPLEGQHDRREVAHLVDRLMLGGVEVYRAEAPFSVDERRYAAGTFVIPMSQVFARYAKDVLESQVYPDVRRGTDQAAEPPYDVTGWSLGLQFGVSVQMARVPLPESLRLTRVRGHPTTAGTVSGTGMRFSFDYVGADSAIAVNRLLKSGAQVGFMAPGAAGDGGRRSHVTVTGVARATIDALARDLGLEVAASPGGMPGQDETSSMRIRAPRVGMYAPWTGGNIDEGWTRWVLERYEFAVTTLHNSALREGRLRQQYDVIILPDQSPREMIEGFDSPTIRPEYRGGIGTAGVANLDRFVAEGGTIVALGAACDLALDQMAVPVRDLRRTLRRDQHSAPGSILRIQVDTTHPIGFGMAPESFGFYNNSPFFALEGLSADRSTVVARYPSKNVLASGWLRGEDLMVGRAAVVSVDMRPGRVVLFGLRPQHRAQTHATFPMLFNALYLSTVRSDAIQTFD